MPIENDVPRSPGWWLEKLGTRLAERRRGTRWTSVAKDRRHMRPGLDLLDDYLRGDPPLPVIAQAWDQDSFRELIRESRMNYAELVVESVRERMIPLGWSTAIDADESGDDVAARIAVANQLELRWAQVARWMLSMGEAYMMVGAPGPNGIPVISAEDPRQVITAADPATGESMAALKLFCDEWTGDELAYVYIPGAVWVARRPAGMGNGYFGQAWEWDATLSAAYPPAFGDLVPVVRFENRDGCGEYEPHLDVLNRINSEILRRVTVAAFQAFRQRAVEGLPLTSDGKDPAPDGANIVDYSDAFAADPGALWMIPEGVKLHDFQAVDLGPIRAAVKDDVQALAAVTRTPLHYITPDAAAGSAEGASVQREGLVYRTEDRRRRSDGGLARVMSMAFMLLGETDRSDVLSIRTIWQPAERYSLAEMADAASKLVGILPIATIQRVVLQVRPEDMKGIERGMADDLQREAEKAALLESVKPAPPPPTAAAPVTPPKAVPPPAA